MSPADLPVKDSATLLKSIALSHPNRDSWPDWIKECLLELEKLDDSSLWKLLIWEGFDFEHALGYLKGKVYPIVHQMASDANWCV